MSRNSNSSSDSPVAPKGRRWLRSALLVALAVALAALAFVAGPPLARRLARAAGRREHVAKLAAERASDATRATGDLPTWAPFDPAVSWPAFRGDRRDGVARGSLPKLPWPPEGPRVRWKRQLGSGMGSLAIVNGRAYTMEQQDHDEAVVCLALDDGHVVWTHRYPGYREGSEGYPGPRSTPTVAGDRVFTIGATGVLCCLEAASGNLLWTHNVLEDAAARNLTWGVAASPLVDGDTVYVLAGGSNASLIAYDATTGEERWRSGSAAASYASPVLVELGGLRQLLAFDASGLSAYQPDNGKPLWSFSWVTTWEVNAAQPLMVDERNVFITSGYDHGCALVALDGESPPLRPREVWSNKELKVKYSGAVLFEGHVYGPDESIFTCIDVKTGERRWKRGRYGFCFPLLVGRHLVIACQDGSLVLVEATPEEHREISRVELLGDRIMNYPALGEGVLLVRNDSEVVCLELETLEP